MQHLKDKSIILEAYIYLNSGSSVIAFSLGPDINFPSCSMRPYFIVLRQLENRFRAQLTDYDFSLLI